MTSCPSERRCTHSSRSFRRKRQCFILLTARQLGVPRKDLARMLYYQRLNGPIGAIPVLGDLYFFGFKSYAKHSAVLASALPQWKPRCIKIAHPSPVLLTITTSLDYPRV